MYQDWQIFSWSKAMPIFNDLNVNIEDLIEEE